MTFILFVIVLIAFLTLSSAQDQLNVAVTVQGTVFDVSFQPGVQSAADMARKLCRENAVALGVATPESLSSCDTNVAAYLQKHVDEFVRPRTMAVGINIDQNQYSISYRPDITSSRDAATQFCLQKADELKVDAKSPVELSICVDTVSKHLSDSVDAEISRRTHATTLTIGNVPFNIRFRTDLRTSGDVATQLCRDNAQQIGVTQDNLAQCIQLVTNRLDEELETAAGIITAPITINDTTFSVKFEDNIESARTVSQRVCANERAGVAVAQQAECVTGVYNLLAEAAVANAKSKATAAADAAAAN